MWCTYFVQRSESGDYALRNYEAEIPRLQHHAATGSDTVVSNDVNHFSSGFAVSLVSGYFRWFFFYFFVGIVVVCLVTKTCIILYCNFSMYVYWKITSSLWLHHLYVQFDTATVTITTTKVIFYSKHSSLRQLHNKNQLNRKKLLMRQTELLICGGLVKMFFLRNGFGAWICDWIWREVFQYLQLWFVGHFVQSGDFV